MPVHEGEHEDATWTDHWQGHDEAEGACASRDLFDVRPEAEHKKAKKVCVEILLSSILLLLFVLIFSARTFYCRKITNTPNRIPNSVY